MNTREWALLIFTILGQLAAGMFLVLLIVRAFAVRKVGVEQAEQWTDVPFYMVFGIMGLGLIAALFHLGKLVHVFGAVPNLATSWMSREVVAAVVFVVLVGIYAFLQWKKMASEGLRTILGWITAVVGLVLLFFMSATYMLPTQPAWDTFATPVNFYTTALLLGVSGTACALLANYARIPKKKGSPLQALLGNTLKGLTVAAVILMGVEFLVLPVYMAYLSTQGSAAVQTLNLLAGTYGAALIIRLVLVFAGVAVMATYLYNTASTTDQESVLAKMAYSAFVLVLVSEVLGRFIFYATNYRIGI